MLMGAHHRRIDKERAGQRTGVRLEPLPELAPEPPPFPAAKAVRDRVPVSKRLWQVTPGRPRAGKGQHGFDAHPIAEYRRATSARCDGGKDGGNLRPCLIRQQQTYRHQVSSSMYTMHGREKTYPGILNSSTRPSMTQAATRDEACMPCDCSTRSSPATRGRRIRRAGQ